MMAIVKQTAAFLAAALIFTGCAMSVEEGGTRGNAITLIENTWADGSITQTRGEQWFTFTATAGTHYLHIGFGTLAHLYVQVYDNGNNPVGDQTDFSGSEAGYTVLTVTSGKAYYIRVTPYSGDGAYRIAFSAISSPPLPPGASTAAITLIENAWKEGALTSSNNEHWFKFTATAGTHYLHVRFGTLPGLPGLYVQLYNHDGGALGNGAYLTSYATYEPLAATSGQVCYVRVSGRESGVGTYRIALSASATAPAN
jgi:hypothetical protein